MWSPSGFDTLGLLALIGVVGWALIEGAFWIVSFLWNHLSWVS